MDRRLFLASTFATAVDLITPKESEKELVLDYLSKDPNLFRVLVLDPKGEANMFVSKEQPDGVLYAHFDVKRAWVLPDGRLELERYVLIPDAKAMCGVRCPKLPNGECETRTAFLDEWTVRWVDNMGHTVKERHSERT